MAATVHQNQCYASKTSSWFVLSVGFWIHKIKSVDNVSEVWGKLHDGTAWFLNQNLLRLFHFSANSDLNAAVN